MGSRVHYMNEDSYSGGSDYPIRPGRRRDEMESPTSTPLANVQVHAGGNYNSHSSYAVGNGYSGYRGQEYIVRPEDWDDQDVEQLPQHSVRNCNNNANSNGKSDDERLRNGNGMGSSGRPRHQTSSSSIPRIPRRPNDEDVIESASGSSVSASSGYGHQPRKYLAYSNNNNNRNYSHSGGSSRERIEHEVKMSRIPEKFHDEKDGSEIYVMDSAFPKRAPPPGSAYSQYSSKSRAPSEMSSVKTKTSRKGGVVVDTMSAPNPFCPNTKGVCCLLVLVNLGLILVTLGFSIVLQLFDPPFVWYCGIAFLIVGFIALIVSLLFCVHLCRESRDTRKQNGLQPGELYWTHHWQKRIAIPGMGRSSGTGKQDDLSTVYSARTDERSNRDSKQQYYDQSDSRMQLARERDSMTPIHSYQH